MITLISVVLRRGEEGLECDSPRLLPVLPKTAADSPSVLSDLLPGLITQIVEVFPGVVPDVVQPAAQAPACHGTGLGRKEKGKSHSKEHAQQQPADESRNTTGVLALKELRNVVFEVLVIIDEIKLSFPCHHSSWFNWIVVP